MIDQIFKQIKYRFFEFSDRKKNASLSIEENLIGALHWFKNSLSSDGGCSAKYSMISHEFSAGYPMSTANWVPVLSRVQQFYPDLSKQILNDENICRELVNWLLRTQRRDGTFPGGYGDFMNQPPVVFNNGMIIHGLLDYYNVD